MYFLYRSLPWMLTVSFSLTGSFQTVSGQDLSLIGSDGDAIDLPLTDSGVTQLAFHRVTTDGPSFDIDVSDFLSEDDQQASVGLSASEDTDPSAFVRLSFAENQNRAILLLYARGLNAGVKYVGTLTASSTAGLKSWRITLHRPSPVAELTADLKRVELNVRIRSPLGDEPSFSFVLSERNRQVPVEGITLRRADESEVTSVIDLEEHLRFTIDGKDAPHITQWPVNDPEQASLRNIPAGGQRLLRAYMRDLPVGEHKLLMQFDALNAKQGTAPQVELVVHVGHSIFWPILVLLFAISISFFVTKGIVNWRQRVKLKEQARSLHRVWLRELRQLAPAVWLRVMRKQAEIVLERPSFLRPPDKLAHQLDKAARLLDLLHRYRTLRLQLRRQGFRAMLRYRLEERLDDIVKRIEPDLLDETQKVGFAAEFDAFEKALTDPLPTYQPLVMRARRRAKQKVSLDEINVALEKIGNKERKNKFAKWWARVDKAQQEAGLEDLVTIDRICAAFQILQDHLEDEDKSNLEELVDLIAREKPCKIRINQVFQLSNRFYFKRIRSVLKENGKARIVPSDERPRAAGVEALSPAHFELDLGIEKLNDSFVAKKRIIADWKLTFIPNSPKWVRKPKPPAGPGSAEQFWFVRTVGKSLVQFAPEAGKLRMAVSLGYDDDWSPKLITGQQTIKPQKGTALRRFALEEIPLIAVSFALALASGLYLYYIPEPHFGSLQDYLALFIWGVGVDQGKNFVQNFQSLRNQAKTSPSSP